MARGELNWQARLSGIPFKICCKKSFGGVLMYNDNDLLISLKKDLKGKMILLRGRLKDIVGSYAGQSITIFIEDDEIISCRVNKEGKLLLNSTGKEILEQQKISRFQEPGTEDKQGCRLPALPAAAGGGASCRRECLLYFLFSMHIPFL